MFELANKHRPVSALQRGGLRSGLSSKKTSSRIRYRSAALLYFVLLLPFVEPYVFKTPGFEAVDSVYACLKLISAATIFFLYATRKPRLIVILMVALQGWIFLATLANSGSISRFAGPAITAVFVLMLCQVAFEDDAFGFLKLVRNLLTCFVVINIISQILVGSGPNDLVYPFLGIDNRWIYCLLPWVAVTFVVSCMQYGRSTMGCWVVYGVALVEVLVAWSVGAVLALAIWPVLWAWESLRCRIVPNGRVTNPFFLLLVVVVANCLLVCDILLPLFADLIKYGLGKDVTLSGRTFLWSTVIDTVRNNMLFGAGVQPEAFDINFFFTQSGGVEGCEVNHPHNQFLNIAYHGGVVALVLYVGVLALAMRQLKRIATSPVAVPIICAFSCLLAASLVDTLDYSLIYLMTYLPFVSLSSCIFRKCDAPVAESGCQ